ncbi:pyruvate oxidase [Breznakiella homolactica]|uniref:Pyruvate oxidase n=1 Tax=Breznakiella homolactica TaxID=2798577 RepID=A0A7T7XL79_9SPIR|nr:pyruvate oxidase [Breznakiella homolactica]QQO08350.1 pyruvate oxidase [Breznakiella homolactica]
MANSIKSGIAMLKVLESWGVDHLYGIPGGSFNSTMDALYEEQKNIRYIQVRHEEAGAIAAAADAKLTGKIGVCFGSAGPGATHLFNGLYDAAMDHVPVLALVGQVASTAMNYDSFQELNENPMFADVGVYNRTVMTPESLPHVVDEAIRRAYEYSGVSVVTIPVDYGFKDIPDIPVSSAGSHRSGVPSPDVKDIDAALKLIEKAERPVLYAGQGCRNAAKELLACSEHFSMPLVMSVLSKGIVPESAENFLGSAGRLSTKPANEALAASDLIFFIGSDFPFAKYFFPRDAVFIQADIDSSKLGRRHRADVSILGDAGQTLRLMAERGKKRAPSAFLTACRENKKNWQNYIHSFDDRNDEPLRAEPVFKEINRIAAEDAVFVTDVGNVTVHAVRHLAMNGKGHRFTTSGWFATMGYGLPGGIAAQLSFPGRQIFTLNGDGAFAMVMQEIITQVKYGLPIINIVLSNNSLGFIDAEQEDTGQPKFGVDLQGADFAKAGEAMGAKGFTVTKRDQLREVFDQARQSKVPVVIDVKIENKRPFPAEAMVLDPEKHTVQEIAEFKKRYEADMPILRDLMAENA